MLQKVTASIDTRDGLWETSFPVMSFLIRSLFVLAVALIATGCSSASPRALVQLTDASRAKIGQRIWANECGGTVAGLTSWNAGENFASLGIGHFIWYPAGVKGPYEESFPGLVRHLVARKANVPQWLKEAKPCPWPGRAAFYVEKDSLRMKQLRNLLAQTISLQAEYAGERCLRSLPKILGSCPREAHDAVRSRFMSLAATDNGLYCLMDYVNFKGEGTNQSERYRGKGWGLLQVLLTMEGTPPPRSAPNEFSRAAKAVLGERIRNAAPKDETRWRAGWFSRCDSYARGL